MTTKTSPMRITLILSLCASAALAGAQYQESAPQPPGAERLQGIDWVDFQVLSIDPEQWLVTASEVGGAGQFQFRMPPQLFRGQRFTADLGDRSAEGRIDVRAEPDARIDEVILETPLGAGGGNGSGAFTGPGDRPGTPGGPLANRPGSPAGPQGSRPGLMGNRPGLARGGGLQEYQVVSFEPDGWILTARGSDGSTVRLEVDPQAFVGYRFRAPVRELRRGQGFAILGLNELPIEDCCRVLGSNGR